MSRTKMRETTWHDSHIDNLERKERRNRELCNLYVINGLLRECLLKVKRDVPDFVCLIWGAACTFLLTELCQGQ